MRTTAVIIGLALIALLIGVSRYASNKVTPIEIQRAYSSQFARVNYYAQNFTKLLHASLEFPPENADVLDRALFHIPEILDFDIMEEATSVGLHADAWGRDPLVSSRFWFFNESTTGDATVRTGRGTTKSGRDVKIAIYQTVVIEQATRKRLRCKLVFDLDALESSQNTSRVGNRR